MTSTQMSLVSVPNNYDRTTFLQIASSIGDESKYVNDNFLNFVEDVGNYKICKFYNTFTNNATLRKNIERYILNNVDNYIVLMDKPHVYLDVNGDNLCNDEDLIFISLMRSCDVTGGEVADKLYIGRHTVNPPDLGIDVVYRPLLCLLYAHDKWHIISQKHIDDVFDKFDKAPPTTKNMQKINQYKNKMHKYTQNILKRINLQSLEIVDLPPLDDPSFFHEFCEKYIECLIEYLCALYEDQGLFENDEDSCF